MGLLPVDWETKFLKKMGVFNQKVTKNLIILNLENIC